ncbi:MAG TPA: hypothetical protein VL048_10965 [Xanthobacteraceae bacterium]|nr:hypothetical protein [Xanthobacteraceae bacterium]
MSLIRSLDRALYRVVTHDLRREHVEHYVKHLAVDDEDTVVPNVIGRGLQIIDNKAGGLLTHASMMIAALGVSAPVVANDYFEQGVIVAEIMLYLLVALGCLRCLSVFQNDLESPHPDAARDEMILRHELFKLCNRAAIGLTMLVLISLPLLYLYVPVKG